MKNVVLMIILFLVWLNTALACKVSGKHQINVSTDLQTQSSSNFSYYRAQDKLADTIMISDCDKDAYERKFLNISMGVNDLGINSATIDSFFFDSLDPIRCEIKNQKLDNPLSFEERDLLFYKRQALFRECVNINVKSTSLRPLVYTKQQRGCVIKEIDKKHAILKGGSCFLKLIPKASFEISFEIADICKTREGFQSLGHDLMEVATQINIAIAGNESGVSEDLKMKSTKAVTYFWEASEDFFELSDNWTEEFPRFPQKFIKPIVTLGRPKFKNSMVGSSVHLSFEIDSRCPKKCVDEICTSECDFSRPFAGEVILKQKNARGKFEYLTSWFAGGVLPPQWHGMYKLPVKSLEKVKFDNKSEYKLIWQSIDPKFDYEMMAKMTNALFLPLPGIPTGDLARQLASGTLRELIGLRNLVDHPDLPGIDGFSDEELFRIPRISTHLNTINKVSNWPPYYEEICDFKNKCRRVRKESYYSFELDFKTLPTQDEDLDLKILTFKENGEDKGIDRPYVKCQTSEDNN